MWPSIAAAGYRCVLPNLPLGAPTVTPWRPRPTARPPARRGGSRTSSARSAPSAPSSSGTTRAARSARVLAAEDPDVVDRLVLTSADALKHFPPLLHRGLVPLARAPRLLGAAVRPLTLKPLRRLPFAFGLIVAPFPTC